MSGQGKKDRRLRVSTWNFSGLCSERKQREVGELLQRLNIDVGAGQERGRERQLLLMAIDGLESHVRIRVDVEGKEGLGSWFWSAW